MNYKFIIHPEVPL